MSVRVSPRAFQRLSLLALVALVFIIVTGGAVRLTGSGLGCSDWPTCEQDQLVAPLEYHALVEFVNRTITGLVSIAVVLAVLGSLVREPRRRDLTVLAWGLVAGVIAQILLGGLTVLFELSPGFVMTHFLVSMALVAAAVVLHERAGRPPGPRDLIAPRPVRHLGQTLIAVTIGVLLVGTVVTGAGPHGGDEDVTRLNIDVLEITRIHAALALTTVGLALGVAWMVRRGPAGPRRQSWWLLGALGLQVAIGYAQYFTGVPELLVGAHILGAALLWIAVLRFWLSLSEPVALDVEAAVAPPGEPVLTPR